MSKIIKLNFFFILSKAQSFGGEHLGASPWCLGFKPWWLCVLRYVMCIYIDISCINMIYETCMMVMNIFKIFW
jgi:hypothetical protein